MQMMRIYPLMPPLTTTQLACVLEALNYRKSFVGTERAQELGDIVTLCHRELETRYTTERALYRAARGVERL